MSQHWKSHCTIEKSDTYHKKIKPMHLCTAYKELTGSFLAGISFLTCDNIKEVKYKVLKKHTLDEDGNGKLEVKEG